jgi:2-polyprenyl-3-methyl-5-hydroxy-6-metoxy-1,4-benzoquinol methylase
MRVILFDKMKHVFVRFIYRKYHGIKTYFLARPPSPASFCFFKMLRAANKVMSSRKENEIDSVKTFIFKQEYLRKYPSSPFKVNTTTPVAVESDDHKWPCGAIYDNHRNYRFNLKLYNYFNYITNFRHMDLGCSGGALVRSFLEDGFVSIGLEGSDVSKRLRSGEWGVIPGHLFTCDIARPFKVVTADEQPVTFHCISAWEVLEHIPESRLDDLIANIANHLEPNGIFVGSVACFPDGDPFTGAVYHVTLHNREWWLNRFRIHGLTPIDVSPFVKEDFVRGYGRGLKDWDPDDGDGFHVVLKKQ